MGGLLVVILTVFLLYALYKGIKVIWHGEGKTVERIREIVRTIRVPEERPIYTDEVILNLTTKYVWKGEKNSLQSFPEDSEQYGLPAGLPIELNWSTGYAEEVIIEVNGVPQKKKESEGLFSFIPSSHSEIHVIARNSMSEIRKVLRVYVFPVPVMDHLAIPFPDQITMETSFDFALSKTPSTLRLTDKDMEQAVSIPSLRSIKSRIEENIPSVSQINHMHGTNWRDDWKRPEWYRRFKRKIFTGLQKMFKSSPVMTDIIQAIRTHYDHE